MKEYDINRYQEIEHLDKYKVEEEIQKVEEMKMSLVSKQAMIIKSKINNCKGWLIDLEINLRY